MSSQTVYFNDPADITKLQGQVGTTVGQVTTNQINIKSTGAAYNVIKSSPYGQTLQIVDPTDPTNY
jgi:hypothetical protein